MLKKQTIIYTIILFLFLPLILIQFSCGSNSSGSSTQVPVTISGIVSKDSLTDVISADPKKSIKKRVNYSSTDVLKRAPVVIYKANGDSVASSLTNDSGQYEITLNSYDSGVNYVIQSISGNLELGQVLKLTPGTSYVIDAGRMNAYTTVFLKIISGRVKSELGLNNNIRWPDVKDSFSDKQDEISDAFSNMDHDGVWDLIDFKVNADTSDPVRMVIDGVIDAISNDTSVYFDDEIDSVILENINILSKYDLRKIEDALEAYVAAVKSSDISALMELYDDGYVGEKNNLKSKSDIQSYLIDFLNNHTDIDTAMDTELVNVIGNKAAVIRNGYISGINTSTGETDTDIFEKRLEIWNKQRMGSHKEWRIQGTPFLSRMEGDIVTFEIIGDTVYTFDVYGKEYYLGPDAMVPVKLNYFSKKVNGKFNKKKTGQKLSFDISRTSTAVQYGNNILINGANVGAGSLLKIIDPETLEEIASTTRGTADKKFIITPDSYLVGINLTNVSVYSIANGIRQTMNIHTYGSVEPYHASEVVDLAQLSDTAILTLQKNSINSEAFSGLKIYDLKDKNQGVISNPYDMAPYVVSAHSIADTFNALAVSNNVAYVAGSKEIHIIDCSNLRNPQTSNSLLLAGQQKMDVSGNHLITSDTELMRSYSLEDPLNPELEYTVSLDQSISDLKVKGTTLTKSNSSGLQVLDLKILPGY